MLEKEIEELKNELSRVAQEKDKFYEILVKIKNSFYQTNVYSQLKEAAEEANAKEHSKEGDTGAVQ